MELPRFECGRESHHNHHVVPQVKGGTKTVPLCVDCHAKVHNLRSTAHPELTKLGLKRAKARGVKLGTPENLTDAARKQGAAKNRDRAIEAYREVMPIILQLRSQGMSLRRIADCLNAKGIATRTGSKWSSGVIFRLLERA